MDLQPLEHTEEDEVNEEKTKADDGFEDLTGTGAPPPAEVPSEEKAAIKKDQEDRRLAEADLEEEPEALLEQVLARARRRENLNIPTMIKIGEDEDEEEFALTGRSLGQINMIMETIIDSAAKKSGLAKILGETNPEELKKDPEMLALAMAALLGNQGKIGRTPEEAKKLERSEMETNMRIAQLLVQPKQKMEGKITWALTEEKARWHLGADQFWTMYLAFLVRDLEGLAFDSKKAVELGGLGKEKPQTRRALSS